MEDCELEATNLGFGGRVSFHPRRITCLITRTNYTGAHTDVSRLCSRNQKTDHLENHAAFIADKALNPPSTRHTPGQGASRMRGTGCHEWTAVKLYLLTVYYLLLLSKHRSMPYI